MTSTFSWSVISWTSAAVYPPFREGQVFDHSGADAALMAHLAFWTCRDPAAMDRLFRQSALMRPKYADREDYRAATINGAIGVTTRVADWAPPTLATVVPVVEPVEPEASDVLVLGRGLQPKWCAENARIVLTTYPVWQDALAFNEFTQQVILTKPVLGSRTPRATFRPRELRDAAEAEVGRLVAPSAPGSVFDHIFASAGPAPAVVPE